MWIESCSESDLYKRSRLYYILSYESPLQVEESMVKKAHIVIKLLHDDSNASVIQIEERIKNEARIPLCKEIEKVSVEDVDASYVNLKNHGVSSNVVKNLMDLYNE